MRRAGALAVAALLVVGGVAAVLALAGGRDEAEVAPGPGPGRLEPDRGAAHDRPAARTPPGEPATSGPHRPELPDEDARELKEDALLHLLELGNVVLLYDAPRPPAALRALQEQVSGPYAREVAAAGQAVVLARRPGLGRGVLALAWRRRLAARDPDDPRLRDAAEAWLGGRP